MYVLGVDFGGGASKATLLNEKGEVVATAVSEYPTYYGAGGLTVHPHLAGEITPSGNPA